MNALANKAKYSFFTLLLFSCLHIITSEEKKDYKELRKNLIEGIIKQQKSNITNNIELRSIENKLLEEQQGILDDNQYLKERINAINNQLSDNKLRRQRVYDLNNKIVIGIQNKDKQNEINGIRNEMHYETRSFIFLTPEDKSDILMSRLEKYIPLQSPLLKKQIKRLQDKEKVVLDASFALARKKSSVRAQEVALDIVLWREKMEADNMHSAKKIKELEDFYILEAIKTVYKLYAA